MLSSFGCTERPIAHRTERPIAWWLIIFANMLYTRRRQGKGQNPKKYSARYICSLVGDLHRTLLYGGMCCNPRSHLRCATKRC